MGKEHTIEKVCWSCDKYKAYYTKGFWMFDKQDCGYCTRHKKQIENKHDTCNMWCCNHWGRKSRKEAAFKALVETAKTLSQIEQILLEEYEENKINPIK